MLYFSLYYNFVVYQAGLFLKGMQEQLHALASCHSIIMQNILKASFRGEHAIYFTYMLICQLSKKFSVCVCINKISVYI